MSTRAIKLHTIPSCSVSFRRRRGDHICLLCDWTLRRARLLNRIFWHWHHCYHCTRNKMSILWIHICTLKNLGYTNGHQQTDRKCTCSFVCVCQHQPLESWWVWTNFCSLHHLHFHDNNQNTEYGLAKMGRIMNDIKNKFSTKFKPCQDLALKCEMGPAWRRRAPRTRVVSYAFFTAVLPRRANNLCAYLWGASRFTLQIGWLFPKNVRFWQSQQ